jgi:nucleotide-binding universal stress UspA family protein
VTDPRSTSSVVVGIDGSPAAVEAARWAVDEAADRDLPLRLVYVIDEKSSDMIIKRQYAESALRAATRAVHAAGKPVRIETSMPYGDVDEVLTVESRAAVLLCVGSVGIGRLAWTLLGSTAAGVAESVSCPVAIVRRTGENQRAPRAIAVAVESSAGSDAAIDLAMREASLRHATVLAVGLWSAADPNMNCGDLDRRMEHWRADYPGVPVHVAFARDTLAGFLIHSGDPVQLAVISTDADAFDRVGPVVERVIHHARCSVLMAPQPISQLIAARTGSTSSIVV